MPNPIDAAKNPLLAALGAGDYAQAAASIYASLAERGDEVVAKVRNQPQADQQGHAPEMAPEAPVVDEGGTARHRRAPAAAGRTRISSSTPTRQTTPPWRGRTLNLLEPAVHYGGLGSAVTPAGAGRRCCCGRC